LTDAAASTDAWGHVYQRPQTNNLGVRVPQVAVAVDALRREGVQLVRHDDHSVVIHPDATGGVIVVAVDHLLPGDPRRG